MGQTKQTETGHATHIRFVHMENITYRNRRSERCLTTITDRFQVARYLDDAAYNAIANRGGSGMGAGCFVELVWGNDDDAGAQIIESAFDPNLPADLPTGSVWHARRFATARDRETVWNGHNHVICAPRHTRAVLAVATTGKRANT